MVTSTGFPWPGHSTARAIVVRPGAFLPPNADLWARSAAVTHDAALGATRALRARWPKADAVVRDGDVVDQILSESTAWQSHAVVIGWRGHGRFRRLLMGSVSRAVLRRAEVPVLVVRRPVHPVTRLVVGVDGSPAAHRAVQFLARIAPPKGGMITVATVLQGQLPPHHPFLPGLTAELRADLQAQVEKQRAVAERRQRRCAEQLKKAGWRVRAQLRTGAPLYELLRCVTETRAQALVLGATSSISPSTRLVGSTTEGAVNAATVPVLVVP